MNDPDLYNELKSNLNHKPMLELISIVCLIFGILQIILFFKIWGMTNDVRAIKEYLIKTEESQKISSNEYPNEENSLGQDSSEKGTFEIGSIVLYTPENVKMKIIGFSSPDVYKCETLDGTAKVYNFKSYVLQPIEE